MVLALVVHFVSKCTQRELPVLAGTWVTLQVMSSHADADDDDDDDGVVADEHE
jgi:hypothetical protein